MSTAEFTLPLAPVHLDGPVAAWSEPVTLPTYEPAPADPNPMFLERRVYQGSSGRVYPLPFIDRIAATASPRQWQAAHIENEFVRVMMLPELGGRIHVGLDKTNGYDFFYRQNVIKPALVGLAGPWISGGVEFNWPQHHRPGTFMPVSVAIEESEDGSRTVWMSAFDPMTRMKGMHGVCLHPGKALVELKVRLFNPTPFTQTFLWWANVAARVHEQYQSFFPPDVHYIADHAKRAMSRFPRCEGMYYGVDYAARERAGGVPENERPSQFYPLPDGVSPADLSWYANIPVPTSYMAMGSREDFFGGYDHARRAGFVHVANRHIAPGKKQWTWGNHEFGYAWDRHLIDADGPYIELMAGVYTDNQPDFSFLAPGETRTFSQYWYPIRDIGPAQAANLDCALSLQVGKGRAHVGVCAAAAMPDATVELLAGRRVVASWRRPLGPGEASLVESVAWKRPAHELTAVVRAGDGREVLRYSPAAPAATPPEVPPPATEPPLPAAIASSDELYLTGLHLEQYRHATRRPEDYWREALRRDPADSRSNHALGRWHLQLGEFAQAERFLNSAIASLTRRNPNPRDGEAYFDLGVTLRYLDRWDEAYAAFYRAAWNFAWQAASYHALAEIDVARGQWHTALDHLDRALRRDADHLKARNLKAVALRALGREREAEEWIRETLALDPLDSWARHLAGQGWPGHNQDRLDLAFDYARAGLCDTALEALAGADPDSGDGSAPMVLYTQAWLELRRGGARLAAHRYARRAQAADPRYCFPNRLEEIAVLRAAVEFSPGDARARYYLGNLFYDRRRHGEAIALWEESARLDPSYSVVWRNLGIAYFNVSRHSLKARVAFDRAVAAAAPGDARVVYERDQLWKRLGIAPLRRLAELKRQAAAVAARDDLAIEVAALYNLLGQPDQARTLLESRQFQPWEGGEGKALGEYARACVALGRGALEAGDPAEARRFLEAALQPPRSLGETWHLLARPLEIYYWMGEAFAAAGNRRDARRWWTLAAETRSATFDPNTHYRALSLRALGKESAAVRLWRDLRGHAAALLRTEPKIDYFATSLPAMLLFEEDLTRRDAITAHLLAAQAALGLGDKRAWQRHTRELRKLDPHHPEAEPKY